MKRIKNTFLGLLLGWAVLWALAETGALAAADGFIAWRNLLVQWSGVLGIGAMSVAMMLAIRPRWVEERLDGLDKMYRLHKWLGITGLVISLVHWLAAQAPKWLVAAGWLTRPKRVPPPESPLAIVNFLRSQRGLAEQVGEIAFYAAVVLIVLALVKRFPYRHFFKTHRLLAVVYLALVLHAVVLLNVRDWATPLGAVMSLMMLGGSAAAIVVLLRRVGSERKAVGEIEKLEFHDGVSVNAITVQLKDRWPGHEAGQFAFVTFDRREGAHPFTIASAWSGDGRLLFLVKSLGDYTAKLASTLAIGDLVQVEGPYGRFDFEDSSQRQVWIGGGIGITPFVARLQALAAQPDGRTVDLYHTTRDVDDTALQRLSDLARAAGVRLRILIDSRDGMLSGERLRREVPDWRSADFWFCGPAKFGDMIRSDLTQRGLPSERFHQELFAMR